MSDMQVFTKLNLKEQREIVVLNAPDSFDPELRKLRGVTVRRKLPRGGTVSFALTFVTRQAEVDAVAKSIARPAEGDAAVWFAHPKGTSRRYSCDFNRYTGWAALGASGFEGVRLGAIDEDWSALRFRRVEYVSSLARDASRTISQKGRERAVGRWRGSRP